MNRYGLKSGKLLYAPKIQNRRKQATGRNDLHAPAALSRNMKTLSEWYDVDKKTGKEIKKGYDLIEPRVNRRERRAKDYYLTKKGKDVVETLWTYTQQLAMDGQEAEERSMKPISEEEIV